MWPSLVGHCVRDAGVARSNRAIPTIFLPTKNPPPGIPGRGILVCSSVFYLFLFLSSPLALGLMPLACPYPTTAPSWNIGRYIATIIPPTTPPRKTMRMGSSMDVKALTAVSTSSS
jgi:hypothetical protein